jgi:DNA-directed RNA polymerase subunit N (RpoN/RPB10)
MGPLCFCSSCGSELYKEWKIINSLKSVKLQSVDLDELIDYDQTELLNGTLMKIMDQLMMPMCCRTIIHSYVDLTPEIFN